MNSNNPNEEARHGHAIRDQHSRKQLPLTDRIRRDAELRARQQALAEAQKRLQAGVASNPNNAPTKTAGEMGQGAESIARQSDFHQQPLPNDIQHGSLTPDVAPPLRNIRKDSAPNGSDRVSPITNHPVADDGLNFIGGERDLRAFNRAHRHSGIVRALRIALPLVAIFILSAVVGAYYWASTGAPEVSIQSAGIENGKMVMRNPELNGVDEKQRPYSLIASQAIQDPGKPSEVELHKIDARVPLDEGLFANILAGTGFFDRDAKTLRLDDNVDITTDDGTTMTLKDASVDMDAGSLLTSNPVSIVTEQARISSESFSVENNGERVIFTNRVKMTLYPDKIQQAEKSGSSDDAKQDDPIAAAIEVNNNGANE